MLNFGLFRRRRANSSDPWMNLLADWKAPHDLDEVLLQALSAAASTLPCPGWYAYAAREPGQPLLLRAALTASGQTSIQTGPGGLLVSGPELAPGVWPQRLDSDSCAFVPVGNRRFLAVACGRRVALCGELSPDQQVGTALRRTLAAFGHQLSPLIDVSLALADADEQLQDAFVDASAFQYALQAAFRFDRSLNLVCRTGAEAVSCSSGYLATWDGRDRASALSLLWQYGGAAALLAAADPRDLLSAVASGQALHWREPALPAQIGRRGFGALTVVPVSVAPPYAAALVLASPRVRLNEAAVREVSVLLAQQLADELGRRSVTERASADYLATMTGICDLLDSADPYSIGHSRQVADVARQLAAALGQAPEVLAAIELGGRLHDLGMCAISLDLPLKSGALSERERQIVQRHTIIGADLLTGLPPTVLPQATIRAIRYHHERWDGKGYPDGLAGEAIPLEARIVAGAEQFVARLSARSYRPALPVENALFLMERLSGSQVDPRVASALIEDFAARGIRPRPPSDMARI